MSFGKRIKGLRLHQEMLQADVAKRLGINQSQYSKLERDALEPNLSIIRSLTKLFNVSADYFLFEKDSSDSLSDEEQSLLDLIRNLTHEQRLILKGFILGLMEQQPPQAPSVAADDIPPKIAAK